jgi:hypothetical protein
VCVCSVSGFGEEMQGGYIKRFDEVLYGEEEVKGSTGGGRYFRREDDGKPWHDEQDSVLDFGILIHGPLLIMNYDILL